MIYLPQYDIYEEWHDKIYLRICMANLYEKYLGVGKSALKYDEWNLLLEGYKKITGEDYSI